MKLLLVLLACFAAANAGSYSYYYTHKFHVFPVASTYTYNVYFRSNWCSSAYYSNVLKVYPGADCSKEGWTETPVSELVAEMENSLKDSLFKITTEVMDRRNAWLKKLDEVIAAYKANYKSYLTKYYDYKITCAETQAEKDELIKERDGKINEYFAKLDASRNEALKKYNEAIAAKLTAIKDYHKKLIENATKCLNTRVEKVKEYKKDLALKIKSYVAKFLEYHVAVLKQKETYYRQVLAKIYGSAEWEKTKVDAVMVSYHRQELREISKLGKEYTAKLAGYMKKLVNYYTCSYTCTLSNSCLRFYQRNYYSCSYRLGCWWRFTSSYRCVRACLAPFSYCWRKVNYKGLCTCDVNKVNKPVTDIVSAMTTKINAIINEKTTSFNALKAKWESYHADYVKAYSKIIADRHVFYIKYMTQQYARMNLFNNGSSDLTPEQKAAIAKLTTELNQKLVSAVAEYKKKLAESISACVASFNKGIASYKKLAFEYVEQVKAKYNTCLSTRAKNIAVYKAKLEKNRDMQKEALEKNIKAAKEYHLKAYDALLSKFHPGTFESTVVAMKNAYVSKVAAYCQKVLSDFDAYQATTISALVQHYSCHYKCSASYCVPTYRCGVYFKWTFQLPTQQCYSLYYTCYRKYGYYYTQ
uniref:Uncharacterized protein n=1 Tax=Ciona savignyi TaxID=51511 RepID=H2YRI4_CIOSA